jgi:hypothetical protein
MPHAGGNGTEGSGCTVQGSGGVGEGLVEPVGGGGGGPLGGGEVAGCGGGEEVAGDGCVGTDLDLHFDGHNLTAARSGLFDYSGTETDARVSCPKIAASDDQLSGDIPYVGSEFCLRTSIGTIGWISINDSETDNENTAYVVINYILFNS